MLGLALARIAIEEKFVQQFFGIEDDVCVF
jgi:hypothetical protein